MSVVCPAYLSAEVFATILDQKSSIYIFMNVEVTSTCLLKGWKPKNKGAVVCMSGHKKCKLIIVPLK